LPSIIVLLLSAANRSPLSTRHAQRRHRDDAETELRVGREIVGACERISLIC
jgi:hypothetical protein